LDGTVRCEAALCTNIDNKQRIIMLKTFDFILVTAGITVKSN